MVKATARFRSVLALGSMLLPMSSGALAGSAQLPTAKVEASPLQTFLMEEGAEIALARSAAPASISRDAKVLVLGATGYHTVANGTNGFVCMVWRSWSDDLGDEQLFNPKVRAPICLNPSAVRSVLPDYLHRTEWMRAGLSRSEMQARFAAAASRGKLLSPEPGAMSYMMSKQGYLADGVGHASPHIMFFVPRADRQDWGANQPNSPIRSAEGAPDPVALFFVSVAHWSDGTPAMAH